MRHIPPPCAQQSPLETAVLVQPSPLQFLPPPWDQQTPRDLARLSQPSIVHLVEPPAIDRETQTEEMRMRPIDSFTQEEEKHRTVLPADAEVLGAARAARDSASLAALRKHINEFASHGGVHTHTQHKSTSVVSKANKQTKRAVKYET